MSNLPMPTRGPVTVLCELGDEWRGTGLLNASGLTPEVRSGNYPQISTDCIYLRGSDRAKDLLIARCPGDSDMLDRIAASIRSIGGEVFAGKPGGRCCPWTEPQPEPAPETVPDDYRREYAVTIEGMGASIILPVYFTFAELAELVASLIRRG